MNAWYRPPAARTGSATHTCSVEALGEWKRGAHPFASLALLLAVGLGGDRLRLRVGLRVALTLALVARIVLGEVRDRCGRTLASDLCELGDVDLVVVGAAKLDV